MKIPIRATYKLTGKLKDATNSFAFRTFAP